MTVTWCCWGIVLCSFMSFTLQIEHCWWSGKVTPFSFWPWRVGSRVSQLTQLLPWCWWDVAPAMLVFLELELPIFRQNTHIPDVREDFTFCQSVPHSQELPVSLYFSDFLATPLNLCLHLWGRNSLFLPVPPACCCLVYCSVSSFQPVKVPAAHGLVQQAHCRPRVFTAQLATGSCTALTHFSLCWPQITGNEQLGRAARLLLPWAGSITLGPAAGAAPAWQCSERLEKFVGRRGFTAPPSAALLSLPLVVPRPLLPGEEREAGE